MTCTIYIFREYSYCDFLFGLKRIKRFNDASKNIFKFKTEYEKCINIKHSHACNRQTHTHTHNSKKTRQSCTCLLFWAFPFAISHFTYANSQSLFDFPERFPSTGKFAFSPTQPTLAHSFPTMRIFRLFDRFSSVTNRISIIRGTIKIFLSRPPHIMQCEFFRHFQFSESRSSTFLSSFTSGGKFL